MNFVDNIYAYCSMLSATDIGNHVAEYTHKKCKFAYYLHFSMCILLLEV